jgi:LacI family transcriptional regulator
MNQLLIDRESKTPVYRQIFEDINQRIIQGEYPPGSMLPPESKLCAIYNVERATVRRALALMVEDGKIMKIPGLGTCVQGQPADNGTGKTRTLLFLLPRSDKNTDRISEPFNAKLIDKMEHECAARGYALLYKSFTKQDTAEGFIRTCNPCGVFFAAYLPLEMYQDLAKRGIPAVLVNQSHPMYPSVCLDNRGGAKMAVESLLILGHKDIGYIGGTSDDQSQVSRYCGYRDTMLACGLPIRPQWVLQGDWTMESGRTAMQQLLDAADLPTALFAANDAMAIGAISVALDAGLSIPADISIVGFDNIDQSAFVRPALSTVAVNYDAMSDAACMLMFDMIERNREVNVNIYVPLNYIERASAGKLPAASL